MRRVLRPVLAALACLLLAGCLRIPPSTLAADPAPSPVPADPAVRFTHPATPVPGPAPFLVRYDGTELSLSAVSYCTTSAFGGTCADGTDNAPPSIGTVREVFVFVPMQAFDRLEVRLLAARSAEQIEVPVTALGGHWWRVRPEAAAGTWTMSILASGDGAGSMGADVVWDAG